VDVAAFLPAVTQVEQPLRGKNKVLLMDSVVFWLFQSDAWAWKWELHLIASRRLDMSLSLEPLFSQRTVFFSHNKSA
jgi:hypothetical protein